MKINNAYLRVTMPDGARWDVPVMVIARNRAEHYKDEFENNLERSLGEDTIPLFEDSSFEIIDWAANNMDWDDVSVFAKEAPRERTVLVDYQEGWMNSDKEIVTEEKPEDLDLDINPRDVAILGGDPSL